MSKFRLVDAQAKHKENPETFQIPHSEDIQRLKVGSTIKIGASFDRQAKSGNHPEIMADWMSKVGGAAAMNVDTERFWVTVTKIEGGSITGTVDNDLVYTAYHGLKYDDVIVLELKNILSIY